MSENVRVTIEGACAIVEITRPAVMNALNNETLHDLRDAVEKLDNDANVRGIIITGGPLPQKEGKPARHSFVAGADIGMLSEQGVVTGKANSRFGQRVFSRIEACRKPVIAAINGFAFGGGLELALACHWRYASDNAQLGLVEGTLGLIPGYGGTQRLARLIGRGRALELILRAARINASEALEYGIVNRMTTQEDLLPDCKEAIADIAKCGPLAVAFGLEAVNRGLETNLEEGLRIEADLFGVISETADMREGCKAFLEKRAPDFQGK